MDHAQRDLALGAELHLLGNAGLATALRIGKALLGNIQFALHQGGNPIPHHGGEDADLAVVDLAQTAVPLAGDTGRQVALLGKGALVDQQRAGVAEMHVGIGDQLPAHVAAIPGRLAQHIVQSLVPAARDSLSTESANKTPSIAFRHCAGAGREAAAPSPHG